MFYTRDLGELKGGIKKQKIAVIDIEASMYNQVELVGYMDDNGYIPFKTVQELLEHILTTRMASYTFYAHFGGRYDYLALIKELYKFGKKITIITSNSRIIIFKFKKGKYTFNFVDSYNLLPSSLANIGKDFKLSKGEFDFNKDFSDEEKLIEYNKRDCEILYKALNEFQDTINNLGGSMKYTIASTSMDLFRRKFLGSTVIKDTDRVNPYIRQAYYGGRCEVFKKVAPKSYLFDFNSLYPSVMIDNYMPVGQAYLINTPKIPDINEHPCAFVEAEIMTPDEDYIPLTPYRFNDKLIFPQGKYKGWYDIVTVYKAMEIGYIVNPERYIIFTDYKKIFKDYISTLWALRQKAKEDGNDSLSTIVKLLMNSLYGKFGQREEQELMLINPPVDDIVSKGYVPYNMPEDLFEEFQAYIAKSISKTKVIHPAISAHVTALAQLKLYNAIESCLRRGIDLYYTDTDSLFTSEMIEHSKELGALKFEGEFQKSYFIAPKLYYLANQKLRMKGFKTEYNKENGEWGILTYQMGDGKIVKSVIPFTEEIAEKLLRKEKAVSAKVIDIAPLKSGLRGGELFGLRETMKSVRTESFEKRYFIDYEHSLPWIVTSLGLKEPERRIYSYF